MEQVDADVPPAEMACKLWCDADRHIATGEFVTAATLLMKVSQLFETANLMVSDEGSKRTFDYLAQSSLLKSKMLKDGDELARGLIQQPVPNLTENLLQRPATSSNDSRQRALNAFENFNTVRPSEPVDKAVHDFFGLQESLRQLGSRPITRNPPQDLTTSSIHKETMFLRQSGLGESVVLLHQSRISNRHNTDNLTSHISHNTNQLEEDNHMLIQQKIALEERLYDALRVIKQVDSFKAEYNSKFNQIRTNLLHTNIPISPSALAVDNTELILLRERQRQLEALVDQLVLKASQKDVTILEKDRLIKKLTKRAHPLSHLSPPSKSLPKL